MANHIHYVGDGRGTRDVFLNGEKVESCVFADTKKGKVRFHLIPLRTDKYRKRALTKTRYGKVEVMFHG